MPAWLISIAKWVVVTFIVPMATKWVEQWQRSKERARKLAEKVKRNQTKTEAYEKDPSDDNFSELP